MKDVSYTRTHTTEMEGTTKRKQQMLSQKYIRTTAVKPLNTKVGLAML